MTRNARPVTVTPRPTRASTIVRVVFTVTLALSLSPAALAQDEERIAAIRVHGNHSTPDDEIVAMSGLRVGDPVSDKALREATKAVRRTHRFSDVEVRRRYLSISDPTQVLAMIVVNEKAGASETNPTPGIATRLRASTMFLPILNYQDGYGFTYGLRTTFPQGLGEHTRVSIPLSWGGERRAGVDVDHWFGGSPGFYGIGRREPRLRLVGGVAASRRENPYYEVSDVRLEARVRAEHPVTSWLRVGATARTAQVTFGNASGTGGLRQAIAEANAPLLPSRTVTNHQSYSADVVVDTRLDPSFPRNAFYGSLSREALRWEGAGAAGRWTTDVRGYIGLPAAMVIALRAQLMTADEPLPASEQRLLGGTDTLRGYDAGSAAGDNLATVSTELRIPLTSPLHVGRFGVKGFVDWGTIWASGSRLADAEWRRGIGGGMFFGAGPVLFDLAAAWAQDGSARVNVGLGVSF